MGTLDLTLPTPAENLALDEALLLRAEAGEGGEGLRLWEWPRPAVVLGAGGRLADDVDEAACRADGVPILRRSSGGGTVLLGAGCLLYTLILDGERAHELAGVRSSYAFILERVAAAFPEWNGVALAGTATSRRPAASSPATPSSGSVVSSCTTARSCTRSTWPRRPLFAGAAAAAGVPRRPRPRRFPAQPGLAGRRGIRRRLRAAWGADKAETEWPAERMRRLATDKYTSDDWIRRR